MKTLFIADLHYTTSHPDPAKQQLLESQLSNLTSRIQSYKPNLLVLCGDSAQFVPELTHHQALLSKLRRVHKASIAFVVGNHELWGAQYGISAQEMIDGIYKDFARKTSIHSLEHNNLTMNGVTIAGSYGHYDGSLAPEFNGEIKCAADTRQMLIHNAYDADFCKLLLTKLKSRLKGTFADAIVTHTVPTVALIGREQTPQQRMYNTWAGSTLIEQIVLSKKPLFFFCGHSHANAYKQTPFTTWVNIGHNWDQNKVNYHGVNFFTQQVTWFKD